MVMNPVSRQLDEETQRLIKEFLEKGNTVTKCMKDQRSENITYNFNFYNKRKVKKDINLDNETDTDIE